MSQQVAHPEIHVSLIGGDGNAFTILGKVRRALKDGGCSADEIAEFMSQATAGDYNELLATAMRWVDVG